MHYANTYTGGMAQNTSKRRRRAVIYARISQDRDHDELGVTRQVKVCRELATRESLEVVATFRDDNLSGYSGKPRPGYAEMVELVKSDPGIEVILAFAPDRLTRHPRELEDLIDLLDAHRIDVITHAAGDYSLHSSGGRMVARAVGAVARHESEVKSERIRAKVSEIAQAGRWHGGPRPYGYRVGAAGGLEVDTEQAQHVRYMARRLREGAALRHIADELSAQRVPTARGLSRWHYPTVRNILMNPAIAGLRQHRGEIVGKASWPAIIDRATWDELQAVLRDPARKKARPGHYLLSGLVFSEDGAKMTGMSHGDGARVRPQYKAAGTSITAEHLERIVVEYVLDLTDKATLPKSAKAPKRPSAIAKLEDELEQLAAMRGKGEISLREWMAVKRGLDTRLQEARTAAPPPSVMPAGIASLLGRRGGLRAAWEANEISDEQKRRALAAVLDKVIVHPHRAGEGIADRIEIIRR
jgi:DNA invertase Pin-like site-specific DNA recombinase